MTLIQFLNTPIQQTVRGKNMAQHPAGKNDKNAIHNKIMRMAVSPLDCLVLLSTFFMLFGAVFFIFEMQDHFQQLHQARLQSFWGRVFIIISLGLLAIRLGFYVYLFILYRRYKPVEAVTSEELPAISVIVPAYNEGELVYNTLKSLAISNYPEDKLQLISIDDGSKDDTWQWMKMAKKDMGSRLSIYQQPGNMGKRQALYRGFQLAEGDILVTVDSDSIVQKDTLRNLVSPFVRNENCGAVAGNVRVLNKEKATIPKMLNVSFTFSFDFIRSAQSVLGTVLCTPGALSAYRRVAVNNCLHDWVNQTFLGRASDIGEDRAMTNMIMQQGYDIKFQSNALVLTDTPEKYRNLYKMFIRWERSNVRENIMMSKFAFRRFREGKRIGPRLLLLNQWLRIITAYPVIALMIIFLILHPLLFTSSLLVSILLFSTIPAIFFARKQNVTESIWAYTYGIFYTLTLFWITPYAIATAGRRGWLTRG